MKLDRDQRHSVYIILLAELDDNGINRNIYRQDGLCHFIQDVFGFYPVITKRFLTRDIDVLFSDFLPELWKMRPKPRGNCYWYSRDIHGWLKRKKLIEKCIEETS